MEFVYLIGSFLGLVFGVYLIYFYFYCGKTERLKKIAFLFLLMGVSFLVLSLFNFLWGFNLVEASLLDFSIITSLIICFRVVLLVLMFSNIFDNKNLLVFLLFYFSIFSSFFLSVPISGIVFLTSFLIVLIISLIVFSRKEFENVGLIGLFYSFIACILFLLLFFGYGNLVYITLGLNVLFFLFLYEMAVVIKKNSEVIVRGFSFKETHSFIIDFLRYFVFIVILVNFVFISTVTLHELGHFGATKFFDCSYTKIVFEGVLPHTEVLCQDDNGFSYLIVVLGGIVFPILISGFFFFSGGTFIREIGLLLIGFNLIISYKDFLDMGFSDVFSLFFTVVGILIVIFAVGFLASSRVEEKKFLEFTGGHKDFYNKGDR